MKKNEFMNLISSKNIVIPMYIYKLLPKLDIDFETFFFLMYLYNLDERIIFNPQKIADEFGITIKEVLLYVDTLSSKKLISFEIIKNDKNVSEEYLSLKYFYDKISLLLIDERKETTIYDNSIFDLIEKEFGRVLSPIEYEIIQAWHENGISDELIKEALKEATFNGVSNLRYIDKILYEWQKKGFKNAKDVENNRKKFHKKNDKVEVFEYNWLEDDE